MSVTATKRNATHIKEQVAERDLRGARVSFGEVESLEQAAARNARETLERRLAAEHALHEKEAREEFRRRYASG
jgi:TRAP-type uncharacterized transport system substrate-binding protein